MTDAHNDAEPTPVTPKTRPAPRIVPPGYRQGIITAITVLLGFSLAFWRFWGFETSGRWTLRSILAALPLVIAVCLQIFALFRSLRVEDDEVPEYRKTVRWFLASAAALLIGLLIAIVDAASGD
ncbi:hypothetical protein [Trinickia sp. EG282A]|uniref:hypothetical protein n=1 Tax=Trinickia sp. EG282A TaxID=3237013 RepID=UPI0034D3143A